MRRVHLGAVALLVLGWGALVLLPNGVRAEEPAEAEVRADAPVPIRVDGEVVPLPARVRKGAVVCAPQEPYYVSQGERYRFQRWQIERPPGVSPRIVDDSYPCVVVAGPALYRARFEREALLQVFSPTLPQFSWSQWVRYGQVVDLEVPEVVAVKGEVRYRFAGWSEGETPFQPRNRLAVLGRTVVEVKWRKEVFIRVQAPEGALSEDPSGWYAEGDTVAFSPRPTLPVREGVRLRFAGWERVGGGGRLPFNAQAEEVVFTVMEPMTLSARYEPEYRVVVRALGTVLVDGWFPEGGRVEAEAEQVVEVTPDEERLVFGGWEGLSEPVRQARLRITVTGPLEVRARYERQFRVKVDAPYGALGAGWYPEGAQAVVRVPAFPQTVFLFRREFAGFVGFYGTGNELRLQVDRPITVVALYQTRLDTQALATVAGVVGAGLLAYLLIEVVPQQMRRRSEERGRERERAGVAPREGEPPGPV